MLTILAIIAVVFLVYFLPSLIAFARRKREANQIFLINLFLGWTVLGWITAMQWALDLPRRQRNLSPEK